MVLTLPMFMAAIKKRNADLWAAKAVQITPASLERLIAHAFNKGYEAGKAEVKIKDSTFGEDLFSKIFGGKP